MKGDTIEDLERSNDALYDSIRKLRDELYTATVWTRIKWVFTGVRTNN